MKERSESIKKNKALNDEFNAGRTAMEAKDYATAEQHFQKAGEMDPARSRSGARSVTPTLPGQRRSPPQSETPHTTRLPRLTRKPWPSNRTTALCTISSATSMARRAKLPEAKEALTKAAQTDPQMSAKAYYNLGANLVNTGKSDEAADFFKKAIEADPNYADAHYQYGICLMAKAQVDASGKITPPEGTADQFQKYLELKPDGPFAQPSKDMLAQLGEKVNTQYKAPGADKACAPGDRARSKRPLSQPRRRHVQKVGWLHRHLTFFIVVIANHVPLYIVRPARGYPDLPAPNCHRRGDERLGRIHGQRTIAATREPQGQSVAPARRRSSSGPGLRNVCSGINAFSTSDRRPGVLLLL